MKGLIFNLLEEYLIETAGLTAYEEMLDCCQFSTEAGFISTVNYPEENLTELLGYAVDYLDISVAVAYLSFGRWLLPHLARLVPTHIIAYQHPKSFLQTLDDIHQIELKKLHPDAKPPQFFYSQVDDSQGVLTYSSSRAMFDLVEGILLGVADYFNAPMIVNRKPRPDLGYGCCDFIICYPR